MQPKVAQSVLAVAAWVALAPVSAVAGQNDDGCASLSASVRGTVRMAVTGSPSALSVRPPKNQAGGSSDLTLECSDAEAHVTDAFAGQFAVFGLHIGWRYDPAKDGSCGATSVVKCYPTVPGQLASATQIALVNDTWKAVRTGVVRFMPYGSGGNVASFGRVDLNRELRRSVARYVDGGPTDLTLSGNAFLSH